MPMAFVNPQIWNQNQIRCNLLLFKKFNTFLFFCTVFIYINITRQKKLKTQLLIICTSVLWYIQYCLKEYTKSKFFADPSNCTNTLAIFRLQDTNLYSSISNSRLRYAIKINYCVVYRIQNMIKFPKNVKFNIPSPNTLFCFQEMTMLPWFLINFFYSLLQLKTKSNVHINN